jgi:hypothetical protein
MQHSQDYTDADLANDRARDAQARAKGLEQRLANVETVLLHLIGETAREESLFTFLAATRGGALARTRAVEHIAEELRKREAR